MQASSRWDLTRGDLCSRLHARATDFYFTNRVLVSFFYFDLTEGSLGNTVAGWCHWRQTRFGHARGERGRPQFTAHNSVRPFENGLSLRSLGSSATRPRAPTLALRASPRERELEGAVDLGRLRDRRFARGACVLRARSARFSSRRSKRDSAFTGSPDAAGKFGIGTIPALSPAKSGQSRAQDRGLGLRGLGSLVMTPESPLSP